MKRVALSVAVCLALGACDRSNAPGSSVASVLSPGQDALAAMETLDRDCLQYPVERRPDGSEVWNADYVYFYLVTEKDGAVATDGGGVPLASGLLRSEALEWMDSREPIAGTGWRWRVMRSVREVREGRVLRESPFVLVDDADLAELLGKDRAARKG